MNEKEWLNIGYSNGIITHFAYEETTFRTAYMEWFKSKLGFVSPQTADRIEVTYNRYYAISAIIEKYISKITELDIINFLNCCCTSMPVTYKEFGRIIQIIRGTLTYMRDIGKGGCPLFDWEKIKRNVLPRNAEQRAPCSHSIKECDISELMRAVVKDKVYFQKQSASLCLCLNFYLGLRVGELASLTFDDFDYDRNVVRIRKTEVKHYSRDNEGMRDGRLRYDVAPRTKTKNGMREVPLLPEARYIVELIKQHHESMGYNSAYLAYDGGQTVLSRSLDRTLRKLISLCSLSNFSTHDIRRNFATILHYKGVPTRVISDLLGHGEIRTTENCYILSNDEEMQVYIGYMREALKYCL